MCDPSIPLTVGEWEEWGNPNVAKFYEYMLSYSPMENGARQQPPLLTAPLPPRRTHKYSAAAAATASN